MRKIRVVIDPGHGGEDRWNRGPTSYIEADGVLKIAKYLKEELENTGHFEVKLTREKDRTLSRKQRAEIAKDFKADLFISEHTNAFNGTAKGTEVFYSIQRPKDLSLANKMSRAIAGHFRTNNRGAKTRVAKSGEDYYGILYFGALYHIPSILLVESLFHDHIKEEQLLLEDHNLRSIAALQGEVIKQHYGIKEKKKKKNREEDPMEKNKEPSKEKSKEKSKKEETVDQLYRVQVGAFRHRENALRLMDELENDGYPTYLVSPK